MKKKMMKGIFVACMLLLGFIIQAQTSSNPVGKWNYTMPDAPPEFGQGQVEFKMQNDKLVLVILHNDYFGDPIEVTKQDDAYVCEYAGGEFYMTMTFNPDGDNLKGMMSVGGYDLIMILTPAKE